MHVRDYGMATADDPDVFDRAAEEDRIIASAERGNQFHSPYVRVQRQRRCGTEPRVAGSAATLGGRGDGMIGRDVQARSQTCRSLNAISCGVSSDPVDIIEPIAPPVAQGSRRAGNPGLCSGTPLAYDVATSSLRKEGQSPIFNAAAARFRVPLLRSI